MMLPITIPLWPDESVDSWIETLAHLNACKPRDLVTQTSLHNGGTAAPLTQSLRLETAQALATTTGVHYDEIIRATLNRYQVVGLQPTIGRRAGEGTWARYTGTKFCPECLKERGLRWTLSWHLSWSNVCLAHRCLLLAQCPTCGTPPRDSAHPHPRTLADSTGTTRGKKCARGCATESLASCALHVLPAASTLFRTEQTVLKVLETGLAELQYTDGAPIPARHFFSDMTLLTRSALTAIKENDVSFEYIENAGLSTRTLAPSLSDAFEPLYRGQLGLADQPTPAPMALATTMALDFLTDPRTREHRFDPLGGHWLTDERSKVIVDKMRRSKLSLHSRYLERLLESKHPRKPKGDSPLSSSQGHRKAAHSVLVLAKARPHSIDAMSLPSCLWPEAIHHAPAMPGRVARGFPYLAPIALAAIGRKPDLVNLATQFGIEPDNDSIRTALNHLVSNEAGAGAVDYLVSLHDHIHEFPPPIDYRRRRRLFPTPAHLGPDGSGLGSTRLRRLARAGGHYRTEAFTWKMNRYVWQLLTGYDPFVTQAAQLLYGPAAYEYRQFVHRMHPELKQTAGEIAEQLLLRHRIGEPVAYDLVSRVASP